jgi:predicted lipid-binding transport protein (Tim44 family)
MARIIAGRFDATVDADGAIEALRREGFAADEIDSFYVPPAGQNAMAPLGGDAPHASAGSRFAGFGAVVGALVGGALGVLVGLAVDSRYGAVAVLFAAGVGAYIGSFLGTMRKVRASRPDEVSVEHPAEPKGGRLVAVKADRPEADAAALKVLRDFRARDVGRAHGTWRNGWKDFDPRAPLTTP